MVSQAIDIDESNAAAKYAIAMAVSYYLKQRKNGIKNVEENLAEFMMSLGPELSIVFLKEQSDTTIKLMIKHEAFEPLKRKYWSAIK